MIDVPETLYSQCERSRVEGQGHRTDDTSDCTLIVSHQLNGSWTIHGLGAPGVRLSRADAVAGVT